MATLPLRALALLAPLPFTLPAAAQTLPPPGTIAWDITEGLTTEIGPRQAASPAEARARAWAKAWLERAGFANVRIEPFRMDAWFRGHESARVVSPFPQPLAITALGNSASTGPRGIEGEIAYFPNHAALVAAPREAVAGKIAFIDHAMRATQDGSGYGFAGPARWTGAGIAAQKGAIATVIRSIGTESHRTPHTGGTSFPDGVAPTPAGALSNPDADNLVRMLARGKPVRIALTMTPRLEKDQESGNVIAELPGTDPALPPILIACHLDSWDLGTGAIDDATGCGIIADAALQARRAGPLKRTIRLLWAGAEEVGVFGGAAYAKAHASEPVGLAMESDFGAGRVWRVSFNLPPEQKALADAIAADLAPLGIARSSAPANGGADVGDTIKAKRPGVIDLDQDGTRYFNLHHTPDDTLDKVDRAELTQNVEAWTLVLRHVGMATGNLSPQD